jgi:hypothetical protein
VAACDEGATPGSGSNAGDASADVPVDQGGAETQNPADCGSAAPTSAACTLAEMVECNYEISTCPGGQPLTRRCTCTGGLWSCIQDLGCPTSETPGGTPQERCGACVSPPGPSVCNYPVESCVAAEDLWNRCTCTAGAWSCSREYDCYPPNTCRHPGSGNCVTNGLVNTGNFCPSDYVQGACEGYPCTPGTQPWSCIRSGDHHLRGAACIYGQWACPIGFTLATLL